MKPIDQPIRLIIAKLNALGFITKFSCAGFTYPGHPNRNRSHGKTCRCDPYVTLTEPINHKDLQHLLTKLTGWKLETTHRPADVVLRFDSDDNAKCKEAWTILHAALDEMSQEIINVSLGNLRAAVQLFNALNRQNDASFPEKISTSRKHFN